MGSLGIPEMLFILVLVLLVFGPKRLPEVGRMVGKGLGEFRRASNELKRSIQTELALEDLDEQPRRRRLPQLPATRPVPVRIDPEDSAAEEQTAAAAPAQTVALGAAPEPAGEALVAVDPQEGPPPAEEPAPAPPAASPLVPH
jgi:TatA/E family protein of Tat protein translocase